MFKKFNLNSIETKLIKTDDSRFFMGKLPTWLLSGLLVFVYMF